ncbi:hypothetical protein QTP88_027059 [Uroleucon formosanum]
MIGVRLRSNRYLIAQWPPRFVINIKDDWDVHRNFRKCIMDIKKKTSGAFKRKQRQQREEMKQKLPKMDKFLTKTKCDISTVSTETENVDS